MLSDISTLTLVFILVAAFSAGFVDAIAGGGDDAFGFIGTQAFSGSGSCVRYQRNEAAGTTLISLRLAGSTSDDLQIVLTGLYDLTASSFVL